MAIEDVAMTPPQCRAARALVGMSQPDLAEAAGVSLSTIYKFETQGGAIRPKNLRDMMLALEAAGVQFIPKNGGGAGVRLRK